MIFSCFNQYLILENLFIYLIYYLLIFYFREKKGLNNFMYIYLQIKYF